MPQPPSRERVLFIGTQFSNLYTAVDTPASSSLRGGISYRSAELSVIALSSLDIGTDWARCKSRMRTALQRPAGHDLLWDLSLLRERRASSNCAVFLAVLLAISSPFSSSCRSREEARRFSGGKKGKRGSIVVVVFLCRSVRRMGICYRR